MDQATSTIKKFYGTSVNAVYTQIWISVCVYVLCSIIKKMVSSPFSIYKILQIFSISLFEKTPVFQAINEIDDKNNTDNDENAQLLLGF